MKAVKIEAWKDKNGKIWEAMGDAEAANDNILVSGFVDELSGKEYGQDAGIAAVEFLLNNKITTIESLEKLRDMLMALEEDEEYEEY